MFGVWEFVKLGMRGVAADTVELNNIEVQFAVSCTQIDVFCGGIPLIWNLRLRARRNLAKLAIFFVCLFAFNIARLQLRYVLFAHGAPWVLAHECIARVNLFLIFVWVVSQRELAM